MVKQNPTPCIQKSCPMAQAIPNCCLDKIYIYEDSRGPSSGVRDSAYKPSMNFHITLMKNNISSNAVLSYLWLCKAPQNSWPQIWSYIPVDGTNSIFFCCTLQSTRSLITILIQALNTSNCSCQLATSLKTYFTKSLGAVFAI